MTTLYNLLVQKTSKLSKYIGRYKKGIYSLILVFGLVYHIFVPYEYTSAEENNTLMSLLAPKSTIPSVNKYNPQDFPNKLTLSASLPTKRVLYVTSTAYSSDVAQTDSTPCITANGFNVCEHGRENIVATNALPFGTRVRFPEIYGDEIFYVMDRMNRRYTTRVDFWKTSRNTAIKFGLKRVKMEVL